MLDAHLFLVTILRVLLVEVIDHALLNCDLVSFLLAVSLSCCNLNVYLGPYGPEIGVEALLSPKWVVRVKHVEGL